MRPHLRRLGAAITTTLVLVSHGPFVHATTVGDEFTGAPYSAPNGGIWRFDTGGGGWGNNEIQTYTSSRLNSRLSGSGP